MTNDFQFDKDHATPAEPISQPAGGETPTPPQQPSMPPQPDVLSQTGQTYTPPTPVIPPQQSGPGSPPPYGAPQSGYSYTQPPVQPQPPYSYYQQPGYRAPYYPPPATQNNGTGFAVASLILGIVALVASCSLVLSLPCAIIGLVLGIVGKSKGAGGMAVAGIILSVLALLATILWIVLLIIFGEVTFWIEGAPYTMSAFLFK